MNIIYFIGIDISKYKHDCFICGEYAEVINQNFSFTNNTNGFNEFFNILSSLDNTQLIRIGLEATGHYGMNLKLFLEKNNYSFMEFNPTMVKSFITGQSLRKTKTDKADAKSIARYLMSIPYKPIPLKLYHNISLKSLTRLRETLVRDRSKNIVRITNILDLTFPEFKPFFKDKLSKTAIFILKKYLSPERIASMRDYNSIKNVSHGWFKQIQFVKLKSLAKNTIGESNNILELELESILDIYLLLNEKIKSLDILIEEEMTTINSNILSIDGIGITTCAVLVAEFGDINKFNSSAAMLAFAGLEPSVNQSGKQEFKGHLVKHGSGHLRYALMNVALYVTTHNEVFSTYYYKKRDEGKCHRVALTHVIKKLIRVIYHLETENIKFDPAKLK